MKTNKIDFLRIAITIIFISLFSLSSFSQEEDKWNLSDCVQWGIDHSLSLQLNQNNLKKESISLDQSKWQLAPSVNGWGNGGMDFRRATDQNNQISSGSSYTISYGLSASLTLFNGFTALNQISAMKFNLLAWNKKIEQEENLLYLNILEAFAKTLMYKEQIEIASEQLQLSLKEKEKIDEKVKLGLLSNSSLDEINATVSGNRLAIEKQTNNYKLSLLSLSQLIELPDTVKFELSGDEFNLFVPAEKNYTQEAIYNEACQNLPYLREKEYQLEYYKKTLSIKRGQALPNLSISGGYSSAFYSTDTLSNGNATPANEQFKNYLNPSLSVKLNIPIFNQRSNEFQIKKSKIDIENAIINLEQGKKDIYKEIQSAIQLLNSYYLDYISASDHLVFVKKSYDIYSEKYSMGLINSTDFITAQNQLTESKTNVLVAKYNWILQDKIIKLYRGQKEF